MDFYNFGIGDDLNEDENEEDQYLSLSSKDGIIFLIDGSEDMFQEASDEDDEENHFKICMKCVQATLQNKIIKSDKDLVAVVFFGTEKTQNFVDSKHVYVYQTLERPNAKRILEIEEMTNGGWQSFDEDYGHSSDVKISDTLWACLNLFSKCNEKLGSKRILLFTNNDEPHKDQAALELQHSITRASDLKKNGIHLELIHLQLPNDTFVVDKFYENLLFSDDDDEFTELPNPTEKLKELLIRVRAKDHKKRTLSKVPLSLGGGVDIGVGIYLLISQCRKPPATKLSKRDNKEVKANIQYYLTENAEILMPQDFKFSMTYAQKKIVFEKEEITEAKKFGESGFTLMGFKPRSKLKTQHHIKPAYFIYPAEELISGSSRLFTALLNRCLDRDVAPICKYISARSPTPYFVALLAQKEVFDKNKIQITPPGFHMVYLPFADDFRKLNLEVTPKAMPEQTDKAKELIKKLKFPFSCENFENPDLQHHWRNIEALALDKEALENFEDYSMPDIDQMDKRAGPIIKQFKEAVFPKNYNPDVKKRKAPDGGEKQSSNKRPLSDKDLKTMAKEQLLDKLKLPELRQLMKDENIKSTGTKKKDLIEAINSHYGI